MKGFVKDIEGLAVENEECRRQNRASHTEKEVHP